MSNQQMRNEVELAYSGETWKRKVQKMRDDEVMAIYLRLKRTGKIK